MSEKTAFLFAGQGSQSTGMGKDFYDLYPEFKMIFDSAKLDFDLKMVCFQNPDNMLMQTQYTQPCMVAFACGIIEILRKKGITPDYSCGLSLGEYSALYSAGVWSFDDTMSIISTRAKAMADASKEIETSMVAIIGLDSTTVEECCSRAHDSGIVSICNINCPDQIVIGGDKIAVEKAVSLSKEAGARRCIPLSVSGPFHTEYMKPAGEALKTKLSDVSFKTPSSEVLFNYLGGPNLRGEDISYLLVNQIQHTVRMMDCIKYLINHGVRSFVEIGPGSALSGFVRKTLKDMQIDTDGFFIHSINNVDDIGIICNSLRNI